MQQVIAYHVIFCAHGFWLPNDPRGSGSKEVRYEPLREFGEATYVDTKQSVARKAHDRSLRKRAKQVMKYPEVFLTGLQARSVTRGIEAMIAKADYKVHAYSILPQHVHMVIARHHYDIEQVVRLLRQAGTARLLEDEMHPFAHLRAENGRLPSIWAQDFRKVFLFTPDEVRPRIRYVENNPVKDGLRPQHYRFVVPYIES